MALVIAFEGVPGSGKTTIIQMLAKDLQVRGLRVEIADIDSSGHIPVLHTIARTYPFGHPARIFLYWTLRLQQYDMMQEILNKADIILADRFWSSTLVFDIRAGGVPLECWEWANQHIKRQPDITFLFEVSLGIAQQRKRTEIMNNPDYAQRVEQAYSQLAGSLSWTRVDATRELVEVRNNCMKIILSRL